MKVGIIGAGMIGATAGKLFVRAGHEVALSNSRGPTSLSALVAELGPRAKAMTVADAARWADVVLLAVPWRIPEALPPADAVAGKIVIDAMNPYDEDGSVTDLGATTSSEVTRKRLPGARLVKVVQHNLVQAPRRTRAPRTSRRRATCDFRRGRRRVCEANGDRAD
jgi:hypothetical protein